MKEEGASFKRKRSKELQSKHHDARRKMMTRRVENKKKKYVRKKINKYSEAEYFC